MGEPLVVDASESVLIHIAQMFYERDMTKQDIANQLGISRFRVARLLDHARSEGIVKIEIRSSNNLDEVLGRQLEQRFSLHKALVVVGDDERPGVDSLASVAATWLAQLLHNGDVLGVAWGSTLHRVAELTQFDGDLDVPVVQICGALAYTDQGKSPMELTARFASQLGNRPHWLPAPALLDHPPTVREMRNNPTIKPTVELFDKVTVALLSIGSFTEPAQSSLMGTGAISEQEIAALAERGAVGDLLIHLFDRDGNFVATPVADRTIAMSVDQLRAVPRLIAVAGGDGKHAAIAGALRTGVIDFLVTDVASAQFALAQQDEEP